MPAHRYVITDLGAVEIGQGLGRMQEGGPEHDHITLLGTNAAMQLLEMHSQNSDGRLIMIDEVTIVGL